MFIAVLKPLYQYKKYGYGFRDIKRLEVFLLPPGLDASPSQGYPSSKFAGTHLYTWAERSTLIVKCLVQEHNAVPRPGLEPEPLDPDSSKQ